MKPEKRYCSSDDDSDGDWGGSKKKKKKGAASKKAAPAPAQPKKAAIAAVGPSTVFKCPHSGLTFETIGQLNIHKHSAYGWALINGRPKSYKHLTLNPWTQDNTVPKLVPIWSIELCHVLAENEANNANFSKLFHITIINFFDKIP